MLTDFASLALAWLGFRLARRPADWRRTYGFDRFSVLVAFVNGVALFGIAVWAVSYAGWVPKLGLMQPPSRDRPGRPTAMILAHLVYGATLGALRSGMESKTAPLPEQGRRLVS